MSGSLSLVLRHACKPAHEDATRSTLDLSFNLIKHIPEEIEKHLTSLKTIFFVQNRISHIANLSGLAANLRSLELGGNRLRVRSM